jgi:transcriptional antiterminator NusG
MEAMGFSDQEEQITNSAETPETGEIESAENSAAPKAEVESPDSEVESSAEELEAPSSDESTEIDSTEAEPAAPESEDASQAVDEVDSEEPAAADPVEDQPVADEQELDTPAEELPTDDDQSEPGLAEVASISETASDKSEKDSVDLDLSFLDEDQVDPAETEEEGRSWYVVHCYSGYENKVRHNLEQRIETMGMKDMIFDIVVPTEEEIEVKEGKRRTVERRVFPGYILVNMIMTEESWYVVRNTPGVTGFVGMGNTPTPLRTEEVSQIIKRMEADAPRIKVTFKSGERVRIVDGPFNDFRGTVAEIDMERAKVRVMVNFFGRETPVELDFLQVEKT